MLAWAISVFTHPGQIAFTSNPLRDHATAQDLINQCEDFTIVADEFNKCSEQSCGWFRSTQHSDRHNVCVIAARHVVTAVLISRPKIGCGLL